MVNGEWLARVSNGSESSTVTPSMKKMTSIAVQPWWKYVLSSAGTWLGLGLGFDRRPY